MKRGGPFYARIIRRIAVYLTWIFARTSITPNQVTFLTLIMVLAGSFFFFFGTYKYNIIAILFFHLRVLFDSVDGQLARIKKKTSIIGHYYDRLIHGVAETLLFVAIAYAAYSESNNIVYFILAFSIMLSVLMLRLVIAEKYRLFYDHKLYPKNEKEEIKKKKTLLSMLKSVHDKLGYVFRHPDIYIILTFFVIINKLHWLLWFYGLTYPFITAGAFIYESKVNFKKIE